MPVLEIPLICDKLRSKIYQIKQKINTLNLSMICELFLNWIILELITDFININIRKFKKIIFLLDVYVKPIYSQILQIDK